MDTDDPTPTIVVDGEPRPIIVSDGTHLYKFLKPIGTWDPDNGGTVYEALILPEQDPPVHVAVKVAFVDPPHRRTPPPVHDFTPVQVAKIEVDTITALPNHLALSGILPIKKHFTDHPYGIEHFCVILPFDSEVSSLRSLLTSRRNLSDGMTLKCISIALNSVINTLSNLHLLSRYHRQITAGNIFYHRELKTVKLSYAASVYERSGIDQIPAMPPTSPASTSSSPNPMAQEEALLPMNTMLEWARAPEVETDEHYWYKYVYMTLKSDIWLFGIAALELAYGKIHVSSRQELLRIAKYISSGQELPDTWDSLRTATAEKDDRDLIEVEEEEEEEQGLKFTDFLPDFIKRWFNMIEENDDLPDDTGIIMFFVKFLRKCLATNPRFRPSAERLLEYDFFKKIDVDMAVFCDSVVQE